MITSRLATCEMKSFVSVPQTANGPASHVATYFFVQIKKFYEWIFVGESSLCVQTWRDLMRAQLMPHIGNNLVFHTLWFDRKTRPLNRFNLDLRRQSPRNSSPISFSRRWKEIKKNIFIAVNYELSLVMPPLIVRVVFARWNAEDRNKKWIISSPCVGPVIFNHVVTFEMSISPNSSFNLKRN